LNAAARPVFNVVIDIRERSFDDPRDCGARADGSGTLSAAFCFYAASQNASPVLLNTTSRTLSPAISNWQITTHIVG
jgi:hypothetical protein